MIAFGLAALPGAAQEIRWTVDPTLSLAWWQINPHLNHLWATTCPREPSWRPGDDRTGGAAAPRQGYAAVIDTVIPLYPRRWALPLCAPAVRGGVATADTTTWSGTRGLILLKADALTMGQSLHDAYARRAIYATGSHPDIRFTIDSLTDVQPGDTLRAVVAGRFEFRGVTKQVRSQAKAWREAGGLRVTARFDLLAEDLTETFGVSTAALGLGVGLALWKYLHVGVDLVLKPIG